jgi:hypothetical protein
MLSLAATNASVNDNLQERRNIICLEMVWDKNAHKK